MGLRELFIQSETAIKHLTHFRNGERQGINYIYRKSFHNLIYFGKQLLNDEFIVSCLLQECYLKAWASRERMESLPHIYRFIRMNLRWQILRHIEKSRHTTYGNTVHTDHLEKSVGDFEDLVEDKELSDQDMQRIKTVTETLSYLSVDAQHIASLYFRQGLNQKQIADRLGISNLQVSNQLNKCVQQIKNMVHVTERKERGGTSVMHEKTSSEILSTKQGRIYDLRKTNKLSFDEISVILGVDQLHVQKQYIQAHQLLHTQSSQRQKNRF